MEELDLDGLKSQIPILVDKIGEEYQKNQGLILTEDDLKCLLYYKIYNYLNDKGLITLPTSDEYIKGSPLHTEVSFFDDEYKLTIKPDIAVFETKSLSIIDLSYNNNINISKKSGKDYLFGGKKVISIELKFCRNKTGVTKEFTNKIKNDYNKLIELKKLISNKGGRLMGYVIVFNKTEVICQQFKDFLQETKETNIKLLYQTGRVSFNNVSNNLI